VQLEVRAVCEVLAEAVATRIVALEGFARAQAELSVRRLESRMMEAVGRHGDWRTALFDGSRALLEPVNATGAALLFDGEAHGAGEVPGTLELREIGRWLDRRRPAPVFATQALPAEAPELAGLAPVACGLLAAPVSNAPGEYLLWFRPEQVRTVTWGGDPTKPFVVGNDPTQLSPRRSFAQWRQVVEGTSEPWTADDLAAARLVAETVTDVIQQFRSVRMLIAQDQLETVSREVRLSDQPVVIADPRGRILLLNEALERLLPAPHRHLEWLSDLAEVFAEPGAALERLATLVEARQPWRGELRLGTEWGGRPLLLRADPILSRPDRLLGFVLFFTDITGKKAAEAARRRFQEGLLDRPRAGPVPLDSQADLVYRNLLALAVENAQLAALEITDGLETARIPDMLQSVRASVARTAEVLEHFVEHTSRKPEGPRRPPNGAAANGGSKRAEPPGRRAPEPPRDS